MRNSKMTKFTQLIATIGVLAASSTAFAAGPLALCGTDQPFVWPNGGAAVPYNPDQGALGVLDNAQATQAVADGFQAWEDVQTATISYTNAGPLPVDVTVDNFQPFLTPAAPDGLSAIVFDDTGEIFDALFGVGSGVLGFAGPEWLNNADCTIVEGVSFLNGPAIASIEGLLDLMVHEFGHYSNLAHTAVNGQLFIGVGDSSGPGDDNTFGSPPFPDGAEVIATMYPFLFGGIDQLARTPHADDRASLSQLYPEADFASSTGSITGTITAGSSTVTGVNVIARNISDPFVDAVSGISSDFTDDFSAANPATGRYRLNGLTPGADYAVYVDEILAGGFSTPLSSPLPGVEEFYNGANESGDGMLDVPTEFAPVTSVAGATVEDIDIIFNVPPPGTALATGDDGNVEIPLPFPFCMAGKAYNSVFINGNGFLTLGAAATGSTFAESAAAFTSGPPRIAGFWDDLSPDVAGMVFYEQTDTKFSVTWDSVPEFAIGGENTFTVTILSNGNRCIDDHKVHDRRRRKGPEVKISIDTLTSTDGLVGVSAGAFATSGFETEIDLTAKSLNGKRPFSMRRSAAVFEQFSADDVDVSGFRMKFKRVGRGYRDRFEHNDSLDEAARIRLPFDSIDTAHAFTSISPEGADIDFYVLKHQLRAGTSLVAEVLTGQVDTVMGLFRCESAGPANPKKHKKHKKHKKSCTIDNAVLVAANDDSNGLLSRIVYEVPTHGTYALAVTFCCDYDFDGIDPGQGEPFDGGRYVLDVFVVDGVVLPMSDESYVEFDLGFDFPYQGSSYSSVFVNSNGYLTFGAGEVLAFNPNIPDFENGLPRIAPLWVDLNPSDGGMIFANSDSGVATINFAEVPEFFFGGSNTFSVSLSASGKVLISYAGVTAPGGISGLAAGGGEPGTAVNLSDGATWPALGTTFELFEFGVSEFDLDLSSLVFQP